MCVSTLSDPSSSNPQVLPIHPADRWVRAERHLGIFILLGGAWRGGAGTWLSLAPAVRGVPEAPFDEGR